MAIVKMASTILAPLVLLLISPNGITLPGEFTVELCVESGKQRGGSMPLVIMRHRMGTALFHGQTGLGTVKSLDLALLVQ